MRRDKFGTYIFRASMKLKEFNIVPRQGAIIVSSKKWQDRDVYLPSRPDRAAFLFGVNRRMTMLLLEGDCLEKMKTIDTGSVDLILCDLRIHHKIDSKYCYPKILSPRYKKKRSGGNEQ